MAKQFWSFIISYTMKSPEHIEKMEKGGLTIRPMVGG